MTHPTLGLQSVEVEPNGFACILADPPWPERGGGGRGAQNHYPVMSVEDIVSLPVAAALAAPNAHCWMWVTNNYLPDGLRALHTWGFRYVSNVAWMKGRIDYHGRLVQQQGLGQYLRGAHELLLFGVRGTLAAQCAERSAFLSPRRKHSVKPAEAYRLIESVSPGPRVELFARGGRPGWTSLGHETSGGDLHAQLRELRQVPGALSRLVAA
jgi:N6-adenosine-specific RNA methylase IME4